MLIKSFIIWILVQIFITGSQSRRQPSKEFYDASRDGKVDFIKTELSNLTHVEKRLRVNNKDGNHTPLYIAALNGHTPVVRALLKAGANQDVKDEGGRTPVYAAAYEGHAPVLALLINAGGDVNTATNDGHTPVLAAASQGHVPVLALLIDAGGDANTAEDGGTSPLMVASYKGHLSVVEALLAAGARVGDVRPSTGVTALHYAARYNHVDVARRLLANGADKTLTNNYGDTPADYSRIFGDGSVARILGN